MATAPRSIFRPRIRTLILMLAAGMIVWSAFSYWSEYSENSARRARELLAPPLGVECIVSLDIPESSTIAGRIVEQSDRWIVLQQPPPAEEPNTRGHTTWIPRERILLIQITH
jgi:hypothetical protein